ncbi:MAG: DUF305 domain-containing protein, partial [Brevundimonas sp.]|nr:DUF305 domain-containing protein [Brevundimonas sp.]
RASSASPSTRSVPVAISISIRAPGAASATAALTVAAQPPAGIRCTVNSIIVISFVDRRRRRWGFPGWEGQGAANPGALLLYMNRAQTLVDDTTFMRAMIPHHSIAINNASKSRISDPRVRELADEIIASQVREIEEMKLLIADIERNGERADRPLPPRPAELTPDMRPKIREAVR